MRGGCVMKQTIEAHLPDNFTELLKAREAAKDRLTMLTEKRAEAETRMATMKTDLGKLDNELAAAVNQGSDTGAIMRKIRAAKGALDDQGRLLELSQGAVASAEADVAAANKTLSDVLQRAIIEGRNAVADRLQGQLAEIEGAIEGWREAIFEMSDGLGLQAPASGTEIILTGLK